MIRCGSLDGPFVAWLPGGIARAPRTRRFRRKVEPCRNRLLADRGSNKRLRRHPRSPQQVHSRRYNSGSSSPAMEFRKRSPTPTRAANGAGENAPPSRLCETTWRRSKAPLARHGFHGPDTLVRRRLRMPRASAPASIRRIAKHRREPTWSRAARETSSSPGIRRRSAGRTARRSIQRRAPFVRRKGGGHKRTRAASWQRRLTIAAPILACHPLQRPQTSRPANRSTAVPFQRLDGRSNSLD